MYKIQTPSGDSFLTEKPNFIRVHSNGVYILTDRERAEGVAYHGTPYRFKDGVICYEVDAGELVQDAKSIADDVDAMLIDQEYRLALLEMGSVK